MNLLDVRDLHVCVDGTEILKGVSFSLTAGETVALMGLNGSGKSTLANVLIGNPSYQITSGTILFNGRDISDLSVTERARLGLFLSFQYPQSVSGVTLRHFLRTTVNSLREARGEERLSLIAFRRLLKEHMNILGVDDSFVDRYLNEGFSGGEKKKAEMLQMLVLNPSLCILDETDSGLDIDALRTISSAVVGFADTNKTFLIITHYKRLLEHIVPDRVLVMKDGRIVKEGDASLVDTLEKEGYRLL